MIEYNWKVLKFLNIEKSVKKILRIEASVKKILHIEASVKSLTIFACILTLLLGGMQPLTARAAEPWPHDTGIAAEAGIVIDMDTGAVIWGQNIHQACPPASITKLLTALVVIENTSSLEDVVTFSHDAVYNVESGSGNSLKLEEGDKLTVRDCLYALLLRSSNQAANALAEHVGGSRDGFVEMMNERIARIGCTESHFANPSGLNDDNQYVTAYDMSMIGRAAFENPTLMEINSTTTYSLPATINNPNGRTLNMEHKLLITTNEKEATYYPAAVAGKTGFTKAALNTLVTCAKDNGRTLVSVVLRSQKTHYADTITLLDFGFKRFQNVDAAEEESALVNADGMIQIEDALYPKTDLEFSGSSMVTLPNGGSLTDTVVQLSTDLPADHPDNAVAAVRFTYLDRVVGSSYLVSQVPLSQLAEETSQVQTEPEETGAAPEADQTAAKAPLSPAAKRALMIGGAALGILLVIGAAVAAVVIGINDRRKKRRRQETLRRERRLQRLKDIGYTEDDFKRMVEERRSR